MTKRKVLAFIILTLLIEIQLNAQITYGLQIQQFGRNVNGGVDADSISVVTYGTTPVFDSPPQAVGLFFECRLKSNFPLLLRTELNYRSSKLLESTLLISNNVRKQLSHDFYTSKKLNYFFELPIDLSYTVVKKGTRVFKKMIDLELGILAGVSFQFQAKGDRETYPIGQAINATGISDVNFAIYNSIKRVNYFYNYGLRAKFGHFILIYRRDILLTASGTNDLSVWGNTYSFKTKYEYESISLGYTFSFKKKIKNKKDQQ